MCSFITKNKGFGKLYNKYLSVLKISLMAKEHSEEKSLNPVADRVEKRTKEIAIKSEKLVNKGLDRLKDLIFKLLEVRPREYRPHEFRRKERGDEE